MAFDGDDNFELSTILHRLASRIAREEFTIDLGSVAVRPLDDRDGKRVGVARLYR